MNLESLLKEKFNVAPQDIEKAKAYQSKYGGRLEKLLVNIGSLPEDGLVDVYQQLLDVPVVELTENDSNGWSTPEWAERLDLDFLAEHTWLPKQDDKPGMFYTCDPLNWEVNRYLSAAALQHEFQLVSKSDFSTLAGGYKEAGENKAGDSVLSEFEEDKLRELATEAPTVNLLNKLFSDGVRFNASDMHLEPYKDKYRIRYRIDGVLHEEGELPAALQLAVISRIKILSNMDIAEKRRPQDGKIELKIANTELDIRVSALPLGKGESVVLRFLRKDAIRYDMDKLGISQDIENKIKQDLRSTSGVILLTGPTGSGKTTSLYTFLNELNSDQVKIITLEDPVEYQLEGVNQVQVNNEIGFDFAAGLRSIVRQDPDIIMLGEIRDQETARIAMQSALTGHLVFSTVHTNDAPSAYTRLIDLGVEEFLLNAAIIAVVAQRLVRKVCPHCSETDENAQKLISSYDLNALCQTHGVDEIRLLKATGCDECAHSGYKGRMSILEYLPCTEEIRTLKKDSHFIPEARKINAAEENRTLLEDGLLKACRGLTTVEEVLRVCA